MARYEFETVIRLRGTTVDDVFDAVLRFGEYPDWWPAIRKASVQQEGAEDGVGTICVYFVRSPLGYALKNRVEIVESARPGYLRFTTAGDLAGYGEYHVTESAGVVEVRFPWHVSTTKSWMNWVAPVARPFFEWSHNHVCDVGGAGLAGRLGADLVSVHSSVEQAQAQRA